MLKIEYTNRFKKEYKLAIKRGYKVEKLIEVITLLSQEKDLPSKYRDHLLIDSKKYVNVRECHIEPDWLLIYEINRDCLVLTLLRTGTHSDLF